MPNLDGVRQLGSYVAQGFEASCEMAGSAVDGVRSLTARGMLRIALTVSPALATAACFPREDLSAYENNPDSYDTGEAPTDSGDTNDDDTDTPWYDYDYDGDGYSVAEGDCDNEDASIHPGAEDDPTDGVDSDCDGTVETGDGDADGDGVPDSVDQCADTRDVSTVDAQGCSDSQRDTDSDGLDDAWEISYGFDPLATDESALDPDADGLTNLQEYTYGTDPTHIDSTVYNSNDNDFGVTYNSSYNVALNQPVELLMPEILSEEEFAAYEATNAPYTVGYPPEYLVDGSSSTLAFSAYNTLYYEIDLEGSYPLENIWVAWEEYGNDGSSTATYMTDWILVGITADGSEVTFANQGSPDSSYSLVVLSEPLQEIEFSKIRIYAEGDNWLGIYEAAAHLPSVD